MAAPAQKLLSLEEYLALEQQTGEKHEYIDGYPVAMAGGSAAHAALTSRATWLLMTALEGRRCATFSADLRVLVEATGLHTYPDLSVVCGPPQQAEHPRHTLTNPTVLVEVLSPTTERYDRGEKWRHYRQIPSLREYVLINTTQPLVEWYRRTPEGWLYLSASAGEQARLASIEVILDIDRLYDGVFELDPEPASG